MQYRLSPSDAVYIRAKDTKEYDILKTCTWGNSLQIWIRVRLDIVKFKMPLFLPNHFKPKSCYLKYKLINTYYLIKRKCQDLLR